jgi:alpha-tubulin suppressor-like RCC1 family protein
MPLNSVVNYVHKVSALVSNMIAVGLNYYGRFGLGDTAHKNELTSVGLTTDWLMVSGDDHHTLGIKTDGTLWSWGRNHNGQLGLGDLTDRYSPVRIGTATNWAFVSAGEVSTNVSFAIKTNGTLWAWGANSQFELGLGNVTAMHPVTTPMQVGTATNWARIAASNHVMAIKTDGTLWGWGYNRYGPLGTGSTFNGHIKLPTYIGAGYKDVAVGPEHTIAVKTNNALMACGQNNVRQLGLNDIVNRSSFTQVGTSLTWSTCATGSNSGLAIRTDGTLWGWGNNGSGELGLGHQSQVNTPIRVGDDTTWSKVGMGGASMFAIMQNKTLWVAGHNSFKQLGLGSASPSAVWTITKVGTDTNWVSGSMSLYSSIFIKSSE